MTLQKFWEKLQVWMFRSFSSFKESSSVLLNPTSRHPSSNWNAETAKILNISISILAKLPSSPAFVCGEVMTKNVHKIPMLLYQTVKLWTFRTWKFSKILRKFRVAKSQELTILLLTGTTSIAAFQVIVWESPGSWSSVTPKDNQYQKEAFMSLVLKSFAKEHPSNTHNIKKRLSKKWPRTLNFTKESKSPSHPVFMETNKSKKQSLVCFLVVQGSSYLIKPS